MRGYMLTDRAGYLAALESLGTLWELGSPNSGWFPLATSTYPVRL
jgi:hypothetical protein